MMRYEHRFRVDAPPEAVAAFHQSAESLRAITPTLMTIQHAPPVLADGDEIRFTLWLGPLPVRWHGLVENFSSAGFDDVQLGGPFGTWHHRHNFVPLADGGTEVYDVVQAELTLPLPKLAIGMLMWITLPVLFGYRAWRTRRLVEAQA